MGISHFDFSGNAGLLAAVAASVEERNRIATRRV
jgi:hypothetical protein